MTIENIPEHMTYLLEGQEERTTGWFNDWRVKKYVTFQNPNTTIEVPSESVETTCSNIPDFRSDSELPRGLMIRSVGPDGFIKMVGPAEDVVSLILLDEYKN
ncbi:MAG: hypothetical protein ABH849_04470 [Nanoarchaeota archaeon]